MLLLWWWTDHWLWQVEYAVHPRRSQPVTESTSVRHRRHPRVNRASTNEAWRNCTGKSEATSCSQLSGFTSPGRAAEGRTHTQPSATRWVRGGIGCALKERHRRLEHRLMCSLPLRCCLAGSPSRPAPGRARLRAQWHNTICPAHRAGL